MTLTTTFEYLETLFPGQALIPVTAAGKCLSFAEQTTRNKVHSGDFPIETFLLGSKRVVRKMDLAAYLDGLSAKAKRGRPVGSTKAARLAREER